MTRVRSNISSIDHLRDGATTAGQGGAATDAKVAADLKGLSGVALQMHLDAHLSHHKDQPTRERYVKAAVKQADGNPDALNKLAALARKHGLKLARCGFTDPAATLRGRVRQDLHGCTTQQLTARLSKHLAGCSDARSKQVCIQEALRSCDGDEQKLTALMVISTSHGVDPSKSGVTAAFTSAAAARGAKGTQPTRVLDQMLHARRKGHSFGSAFYRQGDHGDQSLKALGKLSSKQVGARLSAAKLTGRDLEGLKRVTYQAFCSQVATEIQKEVRVAKSKVSTLIHSAPARRAFLAGFKRKGELVAKLKRMGFAADDAKRVASGGKGSDSALRSGLVKTQKVLDDLDRFASRAELRPEVAVAMFQGYPKKVDEVAKRVGVRSKSFASEAVFSGLKRGKSFKKFVTAVQITSSVVSSIIVGAVTGGVGGVAAGALFSAGTSAITGAPDVVTAVNEEKRAKAAESLGLMSKGAGAAAHRNTVRTAKKYVGGTLLSGLGGAGASTAAAGADKAVKAGKYYATVGADAAGVGIAAATEGTVQGVDAVLKAKGPKAKVGVSPIPLP